MLVLFDPQVVEKHTEFEKCLVAKLTGRDVKNSQSLEFCEGFKIFVRQLFVALYAELSQFWERRRDKTKTCRSEEHTSELQSRRNLVCRLLLEKKKD